jgi:hypothetical protein
MDEDRTRRRRNALAAVAGVVAVVVVIAPMALFAKGDGRFSPGPDISTPSAPDLVFPSPTSLNRIIVSVPEIPFRFPLAAGWPDDSEAATEELGRKGPSRNLDSLELAACSAAILDRDYVDRVRADWTDIGDDRSRQLTTYADDEQAGDALDSFAKLFGACPTEDFDDGITRVGQVLKTDVGDEAWAVVRRFERIGAPAVGLEIIHAIRVGRAVLIDTVAPAGGGGPGPEEEVQRQLDAMTSAIEAPVAAMCVFTEAGCPGNLGAFATPRRRRP